MPNNNYSGGKDMPTWRDNVRKVVPYVPGEQPNRKDVIKLNTNENPYPPAPGVKKALDSFDYETLRKYPDPKCSKLVSAIASYYGLSEDQVFVGVGSDDVLAMSFLTFFNSGKPVLFPDITYSFYDVWADMLRIPYRQVPLNNRFHVDPDDYIGDCGGIVIPNPNAPTGIAEKMDTYEKILDGHPGVVVIIDEAYVDFGAESVLPLIDKYDNLLVVQTFSKSRAMAGSRIGFAMGSPELIKYLSDVKFSFNSYTMDRLTIDLGTAALSDRKYFEEGVNKIIRTREWTKKELKNLGFEFGDSVSNFIFARHEGVSASDLFEWLKSEGIYVRYFDKPRISDYLRITIGADEEMEIFIEKVKTYLTMHGIG
jgi:histidinol-phosphate aminotransferase